jgi:hypothetical protein
MSELIPTSELNRFDLFDTLERPAFKLCQELCGQYEWTSEPWRAKSRVLIQALIGYFSYDPDFARGLSEMYLGAVKDARRYDWQQYLRARK